MRSHPTFRFIKIFSLILVISCSQEEIAELEPVQSLEVFSFAQTQLVEDQYIVVLNEDKVSGRLIDGNIGFNEAMMRREAVDLLSKYRISETNLERVYSSVLIGFCAIIDKSKLEEIKKDPLVKYVEQDRKGRLGKLSIKAPVKGESDPINTQVVPWGIKRVGGPFAYNGKNCVFVIDTGIQLDHPDLNVAKNKAFEAYPHNAENCGNDEHGHGTHVAGTIGAKDNLFGVVGVAAGASLIPVKIFYGPFADFTFSGMIAGIDHVGKVGKKGDVANLSFGGFDRSRALDDAVLNASNSKGIWMVIASGNSRLPAISFSPARVNGDSTITVSAIDAVDKFAWFSHFGFPIKFAAPGVNVYSTTLRGKYRYESGTSMATPHVAGLRLLGDIQANGYALNYPISPSDPIAFRANGK